MPIEWRFRVLVIIANSASDIFWVLTNFNRFEIIPRIHEFCTKLETTTNHEFPFYSHYCHCSYVCLFFVQEQQQQKQQQQQLLPLLLLLLQSRLLPFVESFCNGLDETDITSSEKSGTGTFPNAYYSCDIWLMDTQMSDSVRRTLAVVLSLSCRCVQGRRSIWDTSPQYLDIITNVPLNISRVISATFYPCNIFLISWKSF